MLSKKNHLDLAFEQSIRDMNLSVMSQKEIHARIKTSMEAYAEKNKLTFTKEEVEATIVAGIETLKKAGQDFSFQNWTMPR